MDNISHKLSNHYRKTFIQHGLSPAGVDWGNDQAKLELRYSKMLSIAPPSILSESSILDVGCGYGGLLEYANKESIALAYTGIDMVEEMINKASIAHTSHQFFCGDILNFDFNQKYDFVVCNGILTQKLDVPALEMDIFAAKLIRKMFELCNVGIAFNVMTTKVNFYSNNLYYRNPSEMISWCMSELSPIVKLDHAYPLYEYTVYLYKDHRCA